MKLIKLTTIVFILCTIFTTFLVNADSSTGVQGFNIQLPALKGTKTTNTYTKNVVNVQGYKNYGLINNATTNQNTLNVQVYNETNGTTSATLSLLIPDSQTTYVGGKWTLAKDNAIVTPTGDYHLILRNGTNSVAKATHSGMWYINGSLY